MTDQTTSLPSLTSLPLFTAVSSGAAADRARLLAGPAGAAPAPGWTPSRPDHTDPPSPAETSTPVDTSTDIDWDLVSALQKAAAGQLAETSDASTLDEDDRQQLGRSIIRRLLDDHAETAAVTGQPSLNATEELATYQAVFDALFRLGRLQPLVDDLTVEDIEVTGYDRVVTLHTDGRLQRRDPIARSDADLLAYLQFLATRTGHGERQFSPSTPTLRMALPGRVRLTGYAWVTPRPALRIRRNTLPQVRLQDLVDLDSMPQVASDLLAAAIRARLSVVVVGDQGTGKTRMATALAREIPLTQSIATLETEFEMYLDEDDDRPRPVLAMESNPGTGEIRADGRRAGQVTPHDLFRDTLRGNLNRIIVGEVRSPEDILVMLEAMQAGAGSISTLHANTASDAVSRLATLVLAGIPGMTAAAANDQVATHIDIVVHLTATKDPRTGRLWRHVDEILQVEKGEPGIPALTPLFRAGPDGRLRGEPVLPSFLGKIIQEGFDPDDLHTPDLDYPDPDGRS